jgi:hypothetical protein
MRSPPCRHRSFGPEQSSGRCWRTDRPAAATERRRAKSGPPPRATQCLSIRPGRSLSRAQPWLCGPTVHRSPSASKQRPQNEPSCDPVASRGGRISPIRRFDGVLTNVAKTSTQYPSERFNRNVANTPITAIAVTPAGLLSSTQSGPQPLQQEPLFMPHCSHSARHAYYSPCGNRRA